MTWVAAGVASAAATQQIYQGIKQKKEGAELENSLDKPEFRIPPEIAKNMSEAEMRSYQGLPDEQKAAFLDNQQRAAQTALRSSGDRRGGLGMISQIQAQQDRSSLGLLQQDVVARDKNILRAKEARDVMATYRDKRFEHDYNEYSTDLDYARAQIGAGMQNIAGGVQTAGSAIQSGVANQEGVDGLTRKQRKLHEYQTKMNELETFQKEIEISGTALPNNTGNPLQNKGFSNIPSGVMQQTIDYTTGNPKQQKKIARDMFKRVEQGGPGSQEAFNWITTNLGGGGTQNFGQLASEYAGKGFGKRYAKRNPFITRNSFIKDERNPFITE